MGRTTDAYVVRQKEGAAIYHALTAVTGCKHVDTVLHCAHLDKSKCFHGILDRSGVLAALRSIVREYPLPLLRNGPQEYSKGEKQGPPELSGFCVSSLVESFQKQCEYFGRHLVCAVWLAGVCGFADIVATAALLFSEVGVAEHCRPEELRQLAVASFASRTPAPLYQVCLEVELRGEEFSTPELLCILRCTGLSSYTHPLMAKAVTTLFLTRFSAPPFIGPSTYPQQSTLTSFLLSEPPSSSPEYCPHPSHAPYTHTTPVYEVEEGNKADVLAEVATLLWRMGATEEALEVAEVCVVEVQSLGAEAVARLVWLAASMGVHMKKSVEHVRRRGRKGCGSVEVEAVSEEEKAAAERLEQVCRIVAVAVPAVNALPFECVAGLKGSIRVAATWGVLMVMPGPGGGGGGGECDSSNPWPQKDLAFLKNVYRISKAEVEVEEEEGERETNAKESCGARCLDLLRRKFG